MKTKQFFRYFHLFYCWNYDQYQNNKQINWYNINNIYVVGKIGILILTRVLSGRIGIAILSGQDLGTNSYKRNNQNRSVITIFYSIKFFFWIANNYTLKYFTLFANIFTTISSWVTFYWTKNDIFYMDIVLQYFLLETFHSRN